MRGGYVEEARAPRGIIARVPNNFPVDYIIYFQLLIKTALHFNLTLPTISTLGLETKPQTRD